MLRIEAAETLHDIEAVRQLLTDYGASRNFDAALKNYNKELSELPGRYASPFGALIIAKWNKKTVACVAFQQLDSEVCEMKRMYVQPTYRAKGIAKAMLTKLIELAKERNYKKMKLDTHPTMLAAHRLYENAGFKEIERYNDNPTVGIRFFELVF